MKTTKGFTLVELLVVIAIIGVLSYVIIGALPSSRAKGIDAAIKGHLISARSEAELYSSNNNGSYGTAGAGTGVCSMTGTSTIGNNVQSAIAALGSSTPIAVADSCFVMTNGWAAAVPLKTGGYYCVDSSGAATSTPIFDIGLTDVNCN